jgi:hypothetical protein
VIEEALSREFRAQDGAAMEVQMDDLSKVWTTVGSVGILNQADLAKVHFNQSVIQLGAELLPPTTAQIATEVPDFGLIFPTIQAVVRYNITPVDGLFVTGAFHYHLRIRFRGRVTAKLMQVDIASGMETQRILFDLPATPNFQEQQAFEQVESSTPMDFINQAYYVEATLVAPELVVGHPAAISSIQVTANPVL